MEDAKVVLKEMCSQIWWLVLLRGVSVGVFGLFLLTRPAATIAVVVFFMGIYWVADGLFTVIESIRGRKHFERWGWGLLVGWISFFAGFVVLSQPLATALLTTTFLIYFLALVALVSGFTGIVTGVRLRKTGEKEWSMILGGILHTLFGFVLLGKPIASALVFAWMLGVLAIVGSISLIAIAFRLKRIGQES